MPPEYFYPMLGMVFALGWGVLGTVRWYLKERLKARDTAPPSAVDEGRVGALEARLTELEERLDFTERVLAQERESPRLRGGDGVSG